MSKNTYLILLLVIASMVSISACKHESPEALKPTVSFKEHVQPILTGNCTAEGCHPAVGGEFSLASYNDVIENGEIKDKGEDSKILEKIKEEDANDRMPPPPNRPLTADQIQIIELWIEQGAKNN